MKGAIQKINGSLFCDSRPAVMRTPPSFPSFFEPRIHQFYTERIQNCWGGLNIFKGPMPEPIAIELISNDYLDLVNHPAVIHAQIKSLTEADRAMLMSAIFLQGNNIQSAFEGEMATFLESPRTILCQSGWCANVGLIQTIADHTVPVYVDLLAHMSLWEGAHAARADVHFFRHNDVEHMDRQIKKYGPGVVMVDSVYSTNGSVAPLQDLVPLAYEQGCIIVVDESHSLGTHGPQGKGLVVGLGLTHQVHFRTASLAKAFCGRAGIITCPDKFFDYFSTTSKPAVFSSILLPYEIAGLRETLRLIQTADQKRERLHCNAKGLRESLNQLGYCVESGSQIISVEPGLERKTMEVRDALAAHQVFGSIFCPPATAANHSLIRLSVHSDLTEEQLEKIIRAFQAIRSQVQLSDWPSTKKKRRPNQT